MIKGGDYPVRDLTDNDFTRTKERPDTVYGLQTDEYPEDKWFRKRLDALDSPVIKADLLYVIRNYFIGKEYGEVDFEKWDGSYISMLLIYMRHGGDCIARKDANRKYVDPEEWGQTYDEALAEFRKTLYEIEEWKDFNDEKYSEFRKVVKELRNKEEITPEDTLLVWNGLFSKLGKDEIEDEKFKEFVFAFSNLEDDDSVYQDAHLDFTDNGKNVRIHIWGRDDG
jgi:hypothetical protein